MTTTRTNTWYNVMQISENSAPTKAMSGRSAYSPAASGAIPNSATVAVGDDGGRVVVQEWNRCNRPEYTSGQSIPGYSVA